MATTKTKAAVKEKSSKPDQQSKSSNAPSKVLYRKYRPTSLDNVVGQEQVTNTLKNSLKQGKIGHAYLFIGPRGTGKTSVARIFAHAVNDFEYNLEDSYLDIVEIDAASNTGVDNIRELREKAIIAPSVGKYKVYIIDEIHMLSKSAANALLKTVEEPPEHVIFIMATTEANKVPVTISSRSQIYQFHLADPETMLQHLRKIADLEKIDITDDALKIIVHRGGGSFRDSLSLLDQIITLTDQTITADLLNQALGLPQDEMLATLIDNYQTSDIEQLRTTLKELLNSGLNAETIAKELMQKIIDESLWSVLSLLDQLTNVKPPFADVKLLLALLKTNETFRNAASVTKSTTATISAPLHQTVSSTSSIHSTTQPQSQEQDQPQPITSAVDNTIVNNTSKNLSTNTAISEKLAQSTNTNHAEEANIRPNPDQNTPTDTSQPSFTWEDFTQAVHDDSEAVYLQLQKCEHEFKDNTLHLYPTQKFTVKVLKKSDNSQVLANHLKGYALIVHELEDRVVAKDETLSQISAIMGDVRDIKGETPF